MLKSLACLLALAAAVPAAAETRVVRYSDLNLANPAGMEQLERRIKAAARDVCGVHSTRDVPLGYAEEARACIAKAKADAMQQVAALDRKAMAGG